MRWDHWVSMGLALAATACGGSGGDSSPLASGDVSDTDAAPTGTTPDDTSIDDTDTEVEPAWWSVDAELVVVGGVIDPAASTWRVSLWGQEETAIPCVFDVPIATAASEVAPAVEAGTLVGWWHLSLEAGPDLPGCPPWSAAELQVGLGPYDSRLDAAIDAHEWLDLDLYGLYLQLDPADPVLVVGVAGTEEQFRGEATAVVALPLPDGTYAATTLVLLAL